MKRSTFFLQLFGKVAGLLILSFIINLLLNHFFNDTSATLIKNSILRALPFIFTVVYYDFKYELKKHK